MHFDVLKEPWIPALTLSGKTETLGLEETLLRAHELREILCDSPLETYAIQRFLIAFLMDAYSPETVYERRALYRQGRFDRETLLRYIDLCRDEGVTFDLFDETRPFMQVPYDPAVDGEKETPASSLFHALPRKSSHIHFHHALARERCFTPGQCLSGILACQTFAVNMKAGPAGNYPPCVNKVLCYYVLLGGNNLFETLVQSMLSKAECADMEWDTPKVAWRDTTAIKPMSEYADVSMLAGLTWQPRRLTLIPHSDGMVWSMYFKPGRKFEPNGRWRDPHVSYEVGKEAILQPVKPKEGREPWRDVGAFAIAQEGRGSAPTIIVCQSSNPFTEQATSRLLLYCLIVRKAKYVGWRSDRLNVPSNILLDYDLANRLRRDLAFVESVADIVRLAVKAINNAYTHTEDNAKRKIRLAEEATAQFFAAMYEFFFTRYLPELSRADSAVPGWEMELMRSVNQQAASEARRIVDLYAKRLGDTARYLQAQMVALRRFNLELANLIKERMKVV